VETSDGSAADRSPHNIEHKVDFVIVNRPRSAW